LRPFADGKAGAEEAKIPPEWSGDLLLTAVLEVQRGRWDGCISSAAQAALLGPLESAYLSRRGISGASSDTVQRESLFRGLIVTDAESGVLLRHLRRLSSPPTEAVPLLRAIYGGAELAGETVIVGPQSATAARTLVLVRERVCPGRADCPFWDGAYLMKVVVSGAPDLAAWIPETGTLVISSRLVTDANDLHQLVLVHEMVHAAQARARDRGHEWLTTYRDFSGWSQDASGRWTPQWQPRFLPANDTLTHLSPGSPFSVLPDGTAEGIRQGGGMRDGYVLAKGFRQASDRADLGEELADTVAVAVIAPERFCREGRSIAPRKYAWIARTLLNRSPSPDCAKAHPEHKPGTASESRPD
jgi:hypothetical protein